MGWGSTARGASIPPGSAQLSKTSNSQHFPAAWGWEQGFGRLGCDLSPQRPTEELSRTATHPDPAREPEKAQEKHRNALKGREKAMWKGP